MDYLESQGRERKENFYQKEEKISWSWTQKLWNVKGDDLLNIEGSGLPRCEMWKKYCAPSQTQTNQEMGKILKKEKKKMDRYIDR